ncbi:MAG: chemotaxis protein CheW [Gemmatimonadaceae bacterium]
MSVGPRRHIVTFALGEEFFAADVHEVERVLRYRQPAPVPRLPDWVAGLVEHDGRSLAVVDLRRRFQLPPAPAEVEPRIVVIGDEEGRVGAIVDRVVDVTSVNADQLDPAPALFRGLSGNYLQGVLRRDGRLIVVLHAARLLSATERMMLAAASADA